MAGMVVSTFTGMLGSLLSKLSMLLSDHYKQRKGIRRDIELLNCELTNINAALEKLGDMEKVDGQTKVWRDKVREMGYDIEDCIDIFMHHLGEGDDKDGWFHKIARKIRELRMHYQLADMIQDIRFRVEEQSKIWDRYRIDESMSTSRMVVEVDPRLPALFEDAKRLVGIDGPLDEITKMLMGECGSHSGQLKVVSIIGFGGLGKTTLANQVHSKIKNEFECSAFVSVSRTPDMSKILKDILSGVGFHGKKMEDDVQKIISLLRAQLTHKRYLVTIDDLWSMKDWRAIECALVENNNGSRVITTTRNQDVGSASCSSHGHVYQMQPLNNLHSKRLFFKRLFDTEDSCPEQFREISDDMLKKCRGVPLAITSIASLLANHKHVETWEEIYKSLRSQLDTNPTLEWMRHVLSLSYNDLSHELKSCLLYLGTYPEDYEICKIDLVRKWIAEGFVREKHGLDLEEAAENCFNELINRSMIQPVFREYGFFELWACRVHDLMLELIISKCKEENFITIIDRMFNANGASQVHRMSHQFSNRDMGLMIDGMRASQVRSYISFCVAHCMPPLSRFQLLRVLDMANRGSMDPMHLDLSAINHLFLLRYLRVQGFVLELPKKFGKLKHLMTLDMPCISNYSTDEQVSDFSSLSSLRHLTLPGRVAFKNGLSMLCNLHDLSRFGTGTNNSIECIRDLGELTNLRKLTVTYDGSKPRVIEDNLETVLAASLNKLGNNNLRHLSFSVPRPDPLWGPWQHQPSAQFWSNFLTRPRHLQTIVLHGVMMPKLPNWIVHADRLEYAILEDVQELRSDDVQVLAQFPCLISLRLTAETFPEDNIIMNPNTFRSLKCFSFACHGVPRLTFEPAAMPRLQRLEIKLNACRKGMQGSPVGGIEHLASLEEISLYIKAKCDEASEIESACRDAISRHPKSQAMQIDVSCPHQKFKFKVWC